MNDRDLLKSMVSDLLHLGKKYGEVLVDEFVSKDHKTFGAIGKDIVSSLHKRGVEKLNELPQLTSSTTKTETSTSKLPDVEIGETVIIKNEKVETTEKKQEEEVKF